MLLPRPSYDLTLLGRDVALYDVNESRASALRVFIWDRDRGCWSLNLLSRGILSCMFRSTRSKILNQLHVLPVHTPRIRPVGFSIESDSYAQLRSSVANPCSFFIPTMPKRKSTSAAVEEPAFTIAPIPVPNFGDDAAPPPKRRASQRKVSQPKPDTGSTNPDKNANVLDAPQALRASPDADGPDERMDVAEAGMDVENQIKEEDNDSPLSEISEIEPPPEIAKGKNKSNDSAATKKGVKKNSTTKPTATTKEKKESAKEPQFLDPEAEGDEDADEEEIQAALSRPPPVSSDYLPLPWKGRLGYVCIDSLQTHATY